MKLETLNAFADYITEVNKSIRSIASLGLGADLGPLAEKTARLFDAINNEHCEDSHEH